MDIINNQNYITNKQIKKILNLLGEPYKPETLVIYERRYDFFRSLKRVPTIVTFYSLFSVFRWLGRLEGIYYAHIDTIVIYLFSENDDGDDTHSKQLYSIHALTHEARHRWQDKTSFSEDYEKDADEYATKFVNRNSKKLSKIMHWEDEWEVEEE